VGRWGSKDACRGRLLCSHLDLRHTARRGWDAHEVELTEHLVIRRHLTLSLQHLDTHLHWWGGGHGRRHGEGGVGEDGGETQRGRHGERHSERDTVGETVSETQ
jgi:hypothetical protein